MPILDAALAFALTMLVVATVVSYIVRALKNTAKLRSDVMQEMLTDYFSTEFKPVIEREMNRLKKDVSARVSADLIATAGNFKQADLFQGVDMTKVVDVSTEELTERLKRSDIGKKLLTELGDKAQTVFNELGMRYEVVGNKFTDSFRAKSKIWASIVALILAVVVNIDSIYIAQTYIKNEGARAAVIAQNDALLKGYNTLADTLQQDNSQGSVTKEEFQKAFTDARAQLDVLTSAGFPIGWSYFPHVGLTHPEANDFQERANFWGWLKWILGIGITATLAGLGGPFWYDAVAGLSRVVQGTRAAKKPSGDNPA